MRNQLPTVRDCAALLLALFSVVAFTATANARPLALGAIELPLPGPPAAIVPADLDGDGRRDLAIVVAYTRWDQISIEESTEIDGIDGLVEVLTIVPSLLDRRELWVFLAQAEGGYRSAGEPLELGLDVLSLTAGTEEVPVVAITDEGLSRLLLHPDEASAEGSARIALEPLFEDRPVMAFSGVFLPRLELAFDLDGDGDQDLLFPAENGPAIYLADGEQLRLASRQPPVSQRSYANDRSLMRYYPRPRVEDVDGDGLPDLLMPDDRRAWNAFHLLRGLGGGRFAAAVEPLTGTHLDQEDAEENAGEPSETEDADSEPRQEVVYLGDLDGDGRVEYLTSRQINSDGDGFRQEMAAAKRPAISYAIYPSGSHDQPTAQPSLTFRADGYAFGGDTGIGIPGGLQDLDGDGRLDLVTLTLDFSVFQAVRIMTTKSISLGLDFHIWCQQEDGSFRPVSGLDLSGKLRFNLRNLALGQLSQLAGDFDGDGRADFVQMGRGKKVTIHRGQPGCTYPAAPDLVLKLEEAPRDLGLVRVEDFDGDGLSDLLVIQPEEPSETGVTPTVRLDFYLSGERS